MRDIEYILKNWKHESKHGGIIQYKYSYSNKSLTLFASRPGLLIGLHGRLIEKYTRLLRELTWPDILKVDIVETESRWV